MGTLGKHWVWSERARARLRGKPSNAAGHTWRLSASTREVQRATTLARLGDDPAARSAHMRAVAQQRWAKAKATRRAEAAQTSAELAD